MMAVTGAAESTHDSALQTLYCLVDRAQKEENVLSEVRAFFDDHPDLCRELGDRSRTAVLVVIDLTAEGNVAVKEASYRKARELEAEVAGNDPSPLEKLLANNIVIAWLSAAEAEVTAAVAKGVTPAQADYLDRRRHRAHKRLESAVKAMAVVRKLLYPSPAPIEVATRLGGKAHCGVRRQSASPCVGVGVEN
jgi:hypothetical protein